MSSKTVYVGDFLVCCGLLYRANHPQCLLFFIYIYTLSPNKVIMCILIWLRLNVWVEMVIWNCKICVIIGSFHLVFFVRLFVLIFVDRFRCGFDAMQWPVRSFSAFIHTIRWVFSLNIPLGNIFPLSLLFFFI